MADKRKKHTAEFKAKIALAAIKGERTIAELVREFEVHETQIYQWRKQLLDHAASAFEGSKKAIMTKEADATITALHAKIGQLYVERDFLKKVLGD